jgi:hypothetical protein
VKPTPDALYIVEPGNREPGHTRGTMTKYRTNADGSAVCPHRDLSVCPACAHADHDLIAVAGSHFHFPHLTSVERGLLVKEALNA